MAKLTLAIPCLFGLESLVADELRYQGMAENLRIETGRVLVDGDERSIVKANLLLRTAERVYVLMGEFPAPSFDALFEGVKALEWERLIDRSGKFPIKASSLDSVLKSVPDCQRIVKKAVATRLGNAYRTETLLEIGASYQIRLFLMKDRASLYLDTSGMSLHKRGWRESSNQAPLRETLAAAMVKLSRFKGKEAFLDPFCGSGTIAIEAALAARNIAPGIDRSFSAEQWTSIPKKLWYEESEAARSREYHGEYRIFASDIDPAAVALAKHNARLAGVEEDIEFTVADALTRDLPEASGTLITNPPYGDRILNAAQAEALYRAMGRHWKGCSDWKFYVLTSSLDFEKSFGSKASKRRKLYNGMIPCQLYMFF